MARLKKGIKIVLLALLCYSCSNDNSQYNDIYEEYTAENFSAYKNIYSAAIDSISKWQGDSLQVTAHLFMHEWQLDSAIIFNSDSSRFFTTVNKRLHAFKDTKMDDIAEFGGAKINENWYFYFIPVSMPTLRERYQDSIYAPHTFQELSYIAHRHRFGNALIQHPDGSFEANENWFNYKFFRKPADSINESIDEYKERIILDYTTRKYKGKVDPKEIAEIKEDMASSVRPPEPEKKPLSFMEKIFGREKKLFESEAWKNRKTN